MSIVIVEKNGVPTVVRIGKGDIGDVTPAATAALQGAQTAQAAALLSQQASAQSATDAGGSAYAASGDATAAADSKTAAAASQAAAFTSETSSAEHDAAAEAAAAAALVSQNSAAAHDLAAGVSAAAALVSENNAGAHETAAGNSAVAAHTSEVNAGVSATAAAASAASLSSGLASFNRFFLGEHTADPALDNQGNPLVEGATYFNTTPGAERTRIYLNGAWEDQSADAEAATLSAQLAAAAAGAAQGSATASQTASAASAAAALASQNSAAAHDTAAGVSAAAALVSQNSAAAHDTAAGTSAAAAAASAAKMPTPGVGNELSYIRINADGTAVETRTVPQVQSDLGVNGIPPIRQTVLNGVTNASGYAAMMVAGAGLAVNLMATAAPMRTAFAAAATDFIATLSADTNAVVTVPANSLSFIAQDYVSQTAVAWSHTLAVPQYGSVYNQNCQSLLNFDGAVGATSFIDAFGTPWTTIGGAKLQSNVAKFGGTALGGSGAANALNGTSDGLNCSRQMNSRYGWSMRAWVNLSSYPASGNIAEITGQVTGNGYGASLMVFNNGGSVKFAYNLSSNGSTHDIAIASTGTTTPVLGTWYFVELTFDNAVGAYRLYVNGVQESVTGFTAYICQTTSQGVGLRPGVGGWLNGYIDAMEFLPYCDHPGGTAYAVPIAAPNPATQGYAQDFFSIPAMTMYQVSAASTASGANPSFIAKNRVYVGETLTSAATFSAVVNYALRAQYDSGIFLVQSATLYSKNHFLGYDSTEIRVNGCDTLSGIGERPVNGVYFDGTNALGYFPNQVQSRLTFNFQIWNNGPLISAISTGAAGYRILARRPW